MGGRGGGGRGFVVGGFAFLRLELEGVVVMVARAEREARGTECVTGKLVNSRSAHWFSGTHIS